MLKTKMLKKNYEYKAVLSKGKYFSGKYIDAVIIDNKKMINFLGIAINTKVGKAVIRNKIKRLIRENYKILESSICSGKSIVFLWNKRSKGEDASFKLINEDMISIFERAGLYLEE